jgi:hypothetical protein
MSEKHFTCRVFSTLFTIFFAISPFSYAKYHVAKERSRGLRVIFLRKKIFFGGFGEMGAFRALREAHVALELDE